MGSGCLARDRDREGSRHVRSALARRERARRANRSQTGKAIRATMSSGERFKLSDFEGIPSDPIDDSAPQWELVSASEFLELPEPANVELLGPLVQRGARTLVGGDSGHGKTTLAYALTAAILRGDEFLGYTG